MKPWPAADKSRRIWYIAILSLVATVLLAFLLPGDSVVSAPGTDTIGQFAAWRAFAADAIKSGHLPLWNPYAYSGQPFLGDFQSALLYPPNVIFLFLPLAVALNLSYFLHLLILGWGMGVWATRRGLHPIAAALCGLVAAFSGPVFPHLYAGHLANICTLAWAPWMFLALETAWRGPSLRPLLLAAATVCLQILGGHAQYVFYIAIAAGLHAIVYSILDPSIRKRALPMVAVIYVGAAALAAAQLVPGFAAAAESVRQGKVEFSFVRSLSFAPENLLTLFAPGFFGDLTTHVYWGRAYLWEMCVFVGASGLVMAGVALGDKEHRRHVRADVILAALLFILALGGHTPVLRVLYDYVPGFGSFRSLSKFVFPAMLFGVMALGVGADALIRRRPINKFYPTGLLVAGGLVFCFGIYFWYQPEQLAGFLAFVQRSQESYLPGASFSDADVIHAAGLEAGQSLIVAGGLFCLLGIGFLLAGRWPALRWLPIVVLPFELFFFVRANLVTTSLAEAHPEKIRAFLAAHPGDYRMFNLALPDNGYFFGVPDMWGDDPTVLKRYAEFIAYTQGESPNHASQYSKIHNLPPIYSLLRYRYVFQPDGKSFKVFEGPNPLPRALLVNNYQVLPDRNTIFTTLTQAGFDPRETVLLENEPAIHPQADAAPGNVRVDEITSDSLTLEADTPAPTLLLITDLYSRDWHARPLDGSAQTRYEVMPADYIVRAIPLQAGHHHLIIEYAPPSFRTGVAISLIAWLAWLALAAFSFRRPTAK